MVQIGHFREFEISNFKGLRQFSMQNIGQFNLIGGMNNVGKTTLLEALVLNGEASIDRIRFIMINMITNRFPKHFDPDKRYSIPLIANLLNEAMDDAGIRMKVTSSSGSFNRVWFGYSVQELEQEVASMFSSKPKLSNTEPIEIIGDYVNGKLSDVVGVYETYSSKISPGLDKTYIPMVRSTDLYGRDLVHYYSQGLQHDPVLRRQFIEGLRLFIPDIVDVELSLTFFNEVSILSVRTQSGAIRGLPYYGEGTVKFARILLELIFNKGKSVHIDEIDSGMHYSVLTKFWTTLLLVAHELDVQLFATTHSLECMRSFSKALEIKSELRSRGRYYKLQRLTNDTTKAYCYSYNEFSQALNSENEIRGGN